MKTKDLIRLSGIPESTLHKWRKTKPVTFEVIRLGCEVKQQHESFMVNAVSGFYYQCPVSSAIFYIGATQSGAINFLKADKSLPMKLIWTDEQKPNLIF